MALAFESEDLSAEEVRRRLRWARRQGEPAWLWPDIAPEAWREALRAIEAVVRAALAGQRGGPRLAGDPAAIGLAGYTSGVGPLLGCWLARGLIQAEPAIAAVLALHLRHNRIRAARMQDAALGTVEALLAAGVPTAVLKGAHTASAYFPEPGARPASDIDLLVPAGATGAAEAVLRDLGFACQGQGPRESNWRLAGQPDTPRSLSLVHAEDPWSIDMHASLDLFVGPGAPLAALDLGEPLRTGRPWSQNPGAVSLEQPLLLLHLAAHAGSGLQSLTLLRLVELVLVIRQDTAQGRLDWRALLEAGERTHTLAYAYPALRLCEDLAPATVPALVLDRCARAAPADVVRLVRGMTPATAQRVDGASVAAHFMWVQGLAGRLRQIAGDLVPDAGSWRALWMIYEKRAWRLVRGRFSP